MKQADEIAPRDFCERLNKAWHGDEPEAALRILLEWIQAVGVSEIARKMGIERTQIYGTLRGSCNPPFAFMWGLLSVLGAEIRVRPGKPRRGNVRKIRQRAKGDSK